MTKESEDIGCLYGQGNRMKIWKLTGITSTLLLVLSLILGISLVYANTQNDGVKEDIGELKEALQAVASDDGPSRLEHDAVVGKVHETARDYVVLKAELAAYGATLREVKDTTARIERKLEQLTQRNER